MPTVIIGSARDIVEHCAVPRLLFSDFPLGNPCGHPWRPDMQTAIVKLALSLLDSATVARTTVQAPFEWKHDPQWRGRYNRVRPEDRERFLAIGAERRQRLGQAPRSVTNAE